MDDQLREARVVGAVRGECRFHPCPFVIQADTGGFEISANLVGGQGMSASTAVAFPSKKAIWAGRILSGLAALFLLMDGIMKQFKPEFVLKEMTRLGYPHGLTRGIGIALLACVILYMTPRTSILGAIFLTGYLGGAVATHTRIGDPLFSHILFPTYMAVFIWGGLYLREARLRALIPLRKPI